jgi:CheY-like chemotaxis protein
MLRAMPARSGHEVVVMGSGAEALRLRDDSFELVCTGLAMPGMNGWDVPRASAAPAAQPVDFVLRSPIASPRSREWWPRRSPVVFRR